MGCMTRDEQLFQYLLQLGDSPLILAQRLGEWVGHGPVLEEDIAQANVGLDLLGQARLWLAYAGEVEARFTPAGRDEDALAFLRESGQFRNLLLVEQPNGGFAETLREDKRRVAELQQVLEQLFVARHAAHISAPLALRAAQKAA